MMVAVLGKASTLLAAAAANAARRHPRISSSSSSSFSQSLAAIVASCRFKTSLSDSSSRGGGGAPSFDRSSVVAMAAAAAVADVEHGLGYLNASDAAALDAELMSSPGFSLEQLMELAGLSVAEAVYDVIVVPGKEGEEKEEGGGGGTKDRKKRALVVCGPGNNGGDGLVAARHLVHFGLDATVVYPVRSTKTHFVNLVRQCEDVGISILESVPAASSTSKACADDDHDDESVDDGRDRRYDVVVDAVFGFSFRGSAPREPYASAIAAMADIRKKDGSVLVSVDVPSGWDVDGAGGDAAATTGVDLVPDVLVSLTAPKVFARSFRGRHFVGGRFLPPALAEKYGIMMPRYPDTRQTMEVKNDDGKVTRDAGVDSEDWAAQYQAYLDEIEVENKIDGDLKDVEHLEEKDWTLQYAQYCDEKEREFFGSLKTNEE